MAKLERQMWSNMMMPAHFGARYTKEYARDISGYGGMTNLSVTYVTDKKMLSKYLPTPFEIVEEPLVKVYYGMNRGLGWLAGGGYNMLGVDVPCLYKGKKERMNGNFCLVLWENLTDPILTGREIQGIPKIYAEIADHVKTEGEWRTFASYRGNKIVEIAIKEARPMSKQEKEDRSKAPGQDWFGWKWIPKAAEEGTDVSYPTLFLRSGGALPGQAWWGTGKVEWHRLTWEQNPTQFHIVNALEKLPIIEYREATITKSAAPPPGKMPPPTRHMQIWRPLR